jgi:RNA polymerase sigma-70 factor (ECF subfamily)
LLAITRNQFLKTFRRRRPVDSSSLELDVNQVPEDLGKEEIDAERLQVALDEMPEPYRTVLLMFYFEDLSYQEIADSMQVAIGTVMSRLSRAKGQLRYKLLCPETKDISPAAGRDE